MVPTDYRLDEVCAKLIPGLEAARRSFTDPEQARAAFERAARSHVDTAIAELRELFGDDPMVDRQATLLREQVRATFLPRYTQLALARNAQQRAATHPEGWAAPGRRVALAVAVALLWFFALRFVIARPLLLLPVAALSSAPLWPDVAGWLGRRQHQAALQEVVDDMQAIQQQATAYVADAAAAAPRRDRAPQQE